MLPKEKVEAKLRKNEWVTDRGQTYYYNDNGKKSSGMTVIGDKTYYFDTKLNYMKKGWVATDGRKHYFGEDGAMATGSVKAGDRTYYFDENGDMVTGWQEREGQTYYYDENGVQAFGLKQIDGKECWFDETTGAYKQVNIDTSKPMVAITYDDGPSAVTDRILDILEQNVQKRHFSKLEIRWRVIRIQKSALRRLAVNWRTIRGNTSGCQVLTWTALIISLIIRMKLSRLLPHPVRS